MDRTKDDKPDPKRDWSEDGEWDTSVTVTAPAPNRPSPDDDAGADEDALPDHEETFHEDAAPASPAPAPNEPVDEEDEPDDEDDDELAADGSTTTIGPSITIRGKLASAEDLVVRGRIEAEVTSSRDLRLEAEGVVLADIDVRRAYIGGVLLGDIRASECVELTAGARVIGNIVTPRLIVADGAQLDGTIEMDGLDDLEGLAPRKPRRGKRRDRSEQPSAPVAAAADKASVVPDAPTVPRTPVVSRLPPRKKPGSASSSPLVVTSGPPPVAPSVGRTATPRAAMQPTLPPRPVEPRPAERPRARSSEDPDDAQTERNSAKKGGGWFSFS